MGFTVFAEVRDVCVCADLWVCVWLFFVLRRPEGAQNLVEHQAAKAEELKLILLPLRVPDHSDLPPDDINILLIGESAVAIEILTAVGVRAEEKPIMCLEFIL